jgi:hypothetical protein
VLGFVFEKLDRQDACPTTFKINSSFATEIVQPAADLLARPLEPGIVWAG